MKQNSTIAVLGDVHGHLQLGLCMLARWQRELKIKFDAVLLAGDVGTFTEESQLDSATRSHAKDNPCELEFLHQWSNNPPAPWLEKIFSPEPDGLGLNCPVVMIHGNHEGFAHLEKLAPRRQSLEALELNDLPTVDTSGFIRYLPTGARLKLQSGHIIAGVGGMEAGQRRARYHELAYIDQRAVDTLAAGEAIDIVLTHQGPALVQEEYGAPTLDALLESGLADLWFHGHGKKFDAIATTKSGTRVVPLGDVAFSGKAGEPGLEGWSYVKLSNDKAEVIRETPPFWRDYRRKNWLKVLGYGLVCPDLAQFIPPDAILGK